MLGAGLRPAVRRGAKPRLGSGSDDRGGVEARVMFDGWFACESSMCHAGVVALSTGEVSCLSTNVNRISGMLYFISVVF